MSSLKDYKNICVIELGGTISCTANSPIAEFYHSAQSTISNLIRKIPIENGIKINVENTLSMISHEISKENLIAIGKLIKNLLDIQKYDGFVITMGTNALEDVAYFISLVIDSHIPIVFTGSHYPQNSLSFDGERNLYNAIKVASSKEAPDLGVLVTFGDCVVSARDAIKMVPGLPTNFINPDAGFIGYVIGGQFILRSKPIFHRSLLKNFNLECLKPSIKIAVIYGHLGMEDTLINSVIESGFDGIVSAGFGKGYQPKNITDCLKKAVSQGITVVRCARSPLGYSGEDTKYDAENGFIVSNGLSANKVSLLLFVALSFTQDRLQLKEIFEATK